MSHYRLSPEARADLLEIGDYIALDSPPAALRVLRDLREAARKLAATPGLGHRRLDLAPGPIRF